MKLSYPERRARKIAKVIERDGPTCFYWAAYSVAASAHRRSIMSCLEAVAEEALSTTSGSRAPSATP